MAIQYPKKVGSNTIFLVAFIEGMAVLAIELLGGKIISSYFGTSYTAWTAVLGITLLALTAGYYIGGMLSARKDLPSILFKCLVLASVFIALMLTLAHWSFDLTSIDSFYTGLILSSIIILAPPLVVTGCITSILIQLMEPDADASGKYSGRIYGISTLGGITAVFVFGFFIIPKWGVTWPLLTVALLLMVTAFITVYTPEKKRFALIAAAAFVLMAGISAKGPGRKKSKSFNVVYESEGVLGQLKVLDYKPPAKSFWTRRLLINGIPQTFILNSPEAYSFWRYSHFIAGFATLKDPSSPALLIGLGGGSVARELKKMNFNFDVVELDERIVPLAKKYFYLDTDKMPCYIDDARHFIRQSKKKYDLVVIDVLSGEVQPNYVFTREALSEMKNILNPNSLVVINYQGILNDKEDKAFPALYKTFKASGFHTYYWATDPNVFDDIIFVISQQPVDFTKIEFAKLNDCCRTLPLIKDFLRKPVADETRTFEEVNVLTDDKPVLDQLNQKASIHWRKVMLKDITRPEREEGISLFK